MIATGHRVDRTVFLSYRREDGAWALAVYMGLKQRGYDVFFDFQEIGSGSFESLIVDNIRSRAHFLVILSPSCLRRCRIRGDWLKREIYAAFDCNRNVVPLFVNGFTFSDPTVRADLIGQLPRLSKYNGIDLNVAFFEAGMERLDRQFLSKPLETILQPRSRRSQAAVDAKRMSLEYALLLASPKRKSVSRSDIIMLSLLAYIQLLIEPQEDDPE